MAIYLNFILPNGQETKVHLENELLVGRGEECDVVIGEPGISLNHANISIDSHGKILVIDLKSSNGSFKNGDQITRTFLQINDTLNLNKVKVRIDASKLNAKERLRIGTTDVADIRQDLTMPILVLENSKKSS